MKKVRTKKASPEPTSVGATVDEAPVARMNTVTFDEVFGTTSFSAIERRLTMKATVTADELAEAIEANPDVALPALMRQRVCLMLRGKLKGKPGRRVSSSRGEKMILASMFYPLWLKELREQKKAGLPGSHKELHRRVAEELINFLRLEMSVERFLNAMSEEKSKRKKQADHP